MIAMTIIDHSFQSDVDLQMGLAAVDLYRDIHKGIRAELFALTATAGRIDPDDRADRAALAAHIEATADVLAMHADHEDGHIDPLLREHLPRLAERVHTDHAELEARFAAITDLGHGLTGAAGTETRRIAHVLHLELSGFTSRYLAHQLVEETQIMPALDALLGAPGCGALHGAIVGSIPPDELARALAFMLPAMNVHDRIEMLGGIRMAAPPEAFDGVVGLARSVLEPRDFNPLAAALGLA